MGGRHTLALAISLSVVSMACESDDSQPIAPTGTRLVRETLTSTISATASPACSTTFQNSVHPTYFGSGTRRCMQFDRASRTGGEIVARLTWADRRIDLDLVLNNLDGVNYRQSIAANRGGESVQFTINPNTRYAFIIYLRGVDETYLSLGGPFTGEVTTAFTLDIERPE